MIMQMNFIFNNLFKNINKYSKKEMNNIVNDIYIKETSKIDYNKTLCNKCKSIGQFEIKGYYTRTIIINNNSLRIRILRMKCTKCGKTHAVLFLDFIPYFQLSSLDSDLLIKQKFLNLLYNQELLNRLKKRVNKFIERIKLFKIIIDDSIYNISNNYIKARNHSYLQIHRGFVMFLMF